jgi:Icc protein
MLKRIVSLAMAVLFTSGMFASPTLVKAEDSKKYQRIVIVSDAHYPSKTRELKAPLVRAQKIKQKLRAVQDINNWPDVDLVVFTGDMVQQTGNEEEYAEAKSFVDKFNKPIAVITGNHEFRYSDIFTKNAKLQKVTPEFRQEKLARFQRVYNLPSLYYIKQAAPYLLVFLSANRTDDAYLTGISEEELKWLDTTLTVYSNQPTIIFFHAPLVGTLLPYEPKINSNNFVAQPKEELERILTSHPQVKLWVSGHTHTPPTQPSFDNPVNYYHGILDVQNPTWDGAQVWTNSLYLYPHKIVICTYDHKNHTFMPQFRRVVKW